MIRRALATAALGSGLLLLAACAGSGTGTVVAGDAEVHTPSVDTSGLPQLDEHWPESNPYRGNPQAAVVGGEIFEQACQRCHGPDGLGKGPAPNLRRVTAYCKRIEDAALAQACREDVDAYFVRSVLDGKVRVGVRHMPAWRGVLSQSMVWALMTYLDEGVPR